MRESEYKSRFLQAKSEEMKGISFGKTDAKMEIKDVTADNKN